MILSSLSTALQQVFATIENGKRISTHNALLLYENAPLGLLGYYAFTRKQQLWGNKVFYNRNMHVEISNICSNSCRFCSFARKPGENGAWELSFDNIMNRISNHYNEGITELHIVGALNKSYDLPFFVKLFVAIKETYPQLHIKAFTAVEIEYMAKNAKIKTSECIRILQKAGIDSVAGGGAEIFDASIRKQLCSEKTTSKNWLRIHNELHVAQIPSNCTMLYGHIENYRHRVDHLNRLRILQDKTGGFNCFIPLKYKHSHNALSLKTESTVAEDLRNMAVSRLFLDNIPHLKAYWPMLGKQNALMALHFGADDIDGTIGDTTRIYSMAGADEQKPEFNVSALTTAVANEGFVACERDSLYNEL